ncbi:hypothetical protein SAMN06265348_110152 [Pedobacter westerhofensis]|uniref:Uncharacterized protein n=1 Tax=Pedobacter westerhofensis TaxID=425512 RepID=A0A521F502_9SPHI|nr:hypothetical protein SAMN06265348_110152 [Pedobacter westerhofensis]
MLTGYIFLLFEIVLVEFVQALSGLKRINSTNMRKLLLAISTVISFSAYAQENTLLTQTLWQGTPDVNTVKTAVIKLNSWPYPCLSGKSLVT